MPPRFPKALTAPLVPAPRTPSGSPPQDAAGLSEGFKAALGKKPPGLHDSSRHESASELARAEKSALPERPSKAPVDRKTHIGPRSGHK